jgi:hypothetical protein
MVNGEREIVETVEVAQTVQIVEIAESRLKAAPTGKNLFLLLVLKSAIPNPKYLRCPLVPLHASFPLTFT